MKKTYLLLGVLLILVVLTAACQAQPSATTELKPAATNTTLPKPTPTVKPIEPTVDASIQQAGDLKKGVILDPALATSAEELQVNGYLYSGLVQLDANGKPAPDLAASWTVSDDELDIVFNLRMDATFSDGTPIDADVVVANFYRWFDPNNPLHGNGAYQGWKDNFLGFLGDKDGDGKPVAIVDGMEKQDTYTVLLHLNRRDPDVLTKLAQPYFSIVSIPVLQAGNLGVTIDTVISSGPYVVSVWDEKQLLLAPNNVYWGNKATLKIQYNLK